MEELTPKLIKISKSAPRFWQSKSKIKLTVSKNSLYISIDQAAKTYGLRPSEFITSAADWTHHHSLHGAGQLL